MIAVLRRCAFGVPLSLRQHPVGAALGLFVVLLLPPVFKPLQLHMTLQMLVQVPLLIAVGYGLRSAVPRCVQKAFAAWNGNGIAGLLLASFTLAYWMLPRSMDQAVVNPAATAAKYLTLPLLVGLPLGLSWPRMNFVVRGVLLSELIAMFFRIGWLYLVSPVQVCSVYMLADQQRLGKCMLGIGSAILLWIAYKLMFGHIHLQPEH